MHALYVDHMGNDLSVVKAAKVSFANDVEVSGFITRLDAELHEKATGQKIRSHEALIQYLASHDHWTPFAHTSITLRMAAPVPIRTQCFKHKVGFVENEESRRYISDRPVLFVPEVFRQAPDGDKVKQGSAGPHVASQYWKDVYIRDCEYMINQYMKAVEDGVAPEQARLFLPQGVEVNWYWTGSLYAYAQAWIKRTDSHAQEEIRDLFEPVGEIMTKLFPFSWKALTAV